MNEKVRRRVLISLNPATYDRLIFFKGQYENRLGKRVSWDDFFSTCIFLDVFRKVVEG
jgi:hypothetical protein